MAYGAEYHYQIIREPEFESKMLEIAVGYPRLNELEDAIDWALARKPHEFTQIMNEYYLWITEGYTNNEFPPLRILYRIDDTEKKVYLIDVEID